MDLVGGQGAVGDARSQLLDGQRDERRARVEVEDDVRRARRHVGEWLGPRRLRSPFVVPSPQEHNGHDDHRHDHERGGDEQDAAAGTVATVAAHPALP